MPPNLLPNVRSGTERDTMVVANIPLAKHAGVRYWRLLPPFVQKYYTVYDAVSDAFAGLIRAAELFDASRGFAFSTYAKNWILQAMQRGSRRSDLIRRPQRRFSKDGRDEAIFYPSVTRLIDEKNGHLATDDSEVYHTDAQDLVRRGMRVLSPYDRQVLEAYFRGESNLEVAKRRGVTKQAISLIRCRALKKLKKQIETLAQRDPDLLLCLGRRKADE